MFSKPLTNLDFGEDEDNCDDVQLLVVQTSVTDKQAIEHNFEKKGRLW